MVDLERGSSVSNAGSVVCKGGHVPDLVPQKRHLVLRNSGS